MIDLFLLFCSKDLIGVVDKLNELSHNSSDGEEGDLDDSLREMNCTQDEFIQSERILPDLLSNESIHLLDQSQSHEVFSFSFPLSESNCLIEVSTSNWKSSRTYNINLNISNII